MIAELSNTSLERAVERLQDLTGRARAGIIQPPFGLVVADDEPLKAWPVEIVAKCFAEDSNGHRRIEVAENNSNVVLLNGDRIRFCEKEKKGAAGESTSISNSSLLSRNNNNAHFRQYPD